MLEVSWVHLPAFRDDYARFAQAHIVCENAGFSLEILVQQPLETLHLSVSTIRLLNPFDIPESP